MKIINIILAVLITGILFFVGFRLFTPVHAATLFGIGQSMGASTTLVITAGATNKTMLFWSKKTDLNPGFAVWFGQGADNIVWTIAQRGAGGGNRMSCQTAGTLADSGTVPNTGVWNGYACTLGGGVSTIYHFNLDMSLIGSGTGTDGTITSDSLYIGTRGGGASSWNGAIRAVQIFPYTMTIKQIQNALMATSPYKIGSPSYFFPLTADTDVRGWLNGARLVLQVFTAGTTVADPPIGLLMW